MIWHDSDFAQASGTAGRSATVRAGSPILNSNQPGAGGCPLPALFLRTYVEELGDGLRRAPLLLFVAVGVLAVARLGAWAGGLWP